MVGRRGKALAGSLRRLCLPGGSAVENALFLSLVLVGAVVRLIWLDDVPIGLNQDEASIGYEAWALLEHGVSRHGYPYPVHFVAWGSGQNALYAYVCMPFIAFLGLTPLAVRLPLAILGVAALFAMYAVGRRLVDRRFALCALFVVVVSPWHIMLSRLGLEANLLPVVLLFAFALVLRGIERPRCMVPAFILLALALYAYGTAYAFVPLFTLGILAYGLRHRLADLRHWGVGLLAMATVAVPIGLFLVVNLFDLPGIALPALSMPRLTGDTRLVSENALFMDAPFREVVENAKRAFQILVVDGHTEWIHNALPEFGYFYHPVGLCITVAGAAFMVRDLFRGRHPRNWLVVIWLAAGVLTATLTAPHLNRLSVLFLPLLLCAAYGLYVVLPCGRVWRRPTQGRQPAPANSTGRIARGFKKAAGVAGIAPLVYLALAFVAFTRTYFVDYAPNNPLHAPPSYAQALVHVLGHARAGDAVYLPKDVIYTVALFYARPPPLLYLQTVEIEDLAATYQEPRSFGRFRFVGQAAEAAALGNAFVVHAHEASEFPASTFEVTPFGSFSAVIRRG